MRKVFKIVIVSVLILFVVIVGALGLVVLDVAGAFATGTHTLPNGAAVGTALVVYDPGLSGGAKDAATKIGYNLQSGGYTVVLAGVKSSTAANVTSYDVVVVGGPIYGGQASSSVRGYLSDLDSTPGTKVGVFGFGSVRIDDGDLVSVMNEVAPLPNSSSLSIDAVAKIVSGNSMDKQCSDFVTELLN
jgi:flavodoxin